MRNIVFVSVDDYMFVGDSKVDVDRAFAIIDTEAQQLGLSWNPKKDLGISELVLQLEALGLLLNTADHSNKLSAQTP